MLVSFIRQVPSVSLQIHNPGKKKKKGGKKMRFQPISYKSLAVNISIKSAFNSAGCQQLWQLRRALASTGYLSEAAVVGGDRISLNSCVGDLLKGLVDQSSLSGSKLPWPSEYSHILKGEAGVICNVEGRLTFCQDDSSWRRQIKAEQCFYFSSSDGRFCACSEAEMCLPFSVWKKVYTPLVLFLRSTEQDLCLLWPSRKYNLLNCIFNVQCFTYR